MTPRRRRPRRRFPWKQNFRQLPGAILTKARTLGGPVVVAAPLELPIQQIRDGVYEHVDIRWMDGELVFLPEMLPAPDIGRWSSTNVNGYEVVRRDLPMIDKTFSMETPNWGDSTKGTHTVYITRKVYQRDLIPPKQLALKFETIGQAVGRDLIVFRCTVDEVLDPAAQNFEADLFYNLNLLQENVGRSDVFRTDARIEDYLGSLYVGWEILPPGARDSNLNVILTKVRDLSDRQKLELVERYDVLARLRPASFVVGTSGFRHYFGAVFEEDLVVFENIEYGNALYVMGENWEALSQLSRTDLMARAQRDFLRIPHAGKWKSRLRAEIQGRRRRN